MIFFKIKIFAWIFSHLTKEKKYFDVGWFFSYLSSWKIKRICTLETGLSSWKWVLLVGSYTYWFLFPFMRLLPLYIQLCPMFRKCMNRELILKDNENINHW